MSTSPADDPSPRWVGDGDPNVDQPRVLTRRTRDLARRSNWQSVLLVVVLVALAGVIGWATAQRQVLDAQRQVLKAHDEQVEEQQKTIDRLRERADEQQKVIDGELLHHQRVLPPGAP